MESITMKSSYRTVYLIVAIVLISSLALGGCSGISEKKMYTIGVVNLAAAFDPILEGFKAGMEEGGYKEGENVSYLYTGPASNPDALDAVLENLKSQDVDLVLTFGTTATLKAKQLLEGTDIPVIFGPVTDPVSSGIVTDLTNPGGNITGIRTGNPTPKRLEWLMAIAPDIKLIYVFNNPNDKSSAAAIEALAETASLYGIELVVRDAGNPEEIDAGLSSIPEDVDAIFIPASAFFEAQINKFIDAANEHQLPLAAPATANVWTGALTSFGHDNIPLGKQASRMAIQILSGVKPSDLPIENADLFLAINLLAARTIGLNIPDEIIRQADIIVR
jgi:putative tryptophan/tyrosine transport system substrate-binding protein